MVVLTSRILALEKALSDLISVADRCDSWESFPCEDLDSAQDVLDAKIKLDI